MGTVSQTASDLLEAAAPGDARSFTILFERHRDRVLYFVRRTLTDVRDAEDVAASAGQLGVTTYIVPALAIILGLIVFGEVPAPLAIAGGIVCLVGVALSRRRTRIPKPSETVAE